MMEILATLVSALVGALLDRAMAWHTNRQRWRYNQRIEALEKTLSIERINNTIDTNIARETNLRTLVDRL